jgi:hypothetical protein
MIDGNTEQISLEWGEGEIILERTKENGFWRYSVK